MASYLGAGTLGASVVVLADGVSLNASSTAAQSVCTPTQQFVPLYFVFRGAGHTLNAATTISVGATGATTQWVNAFTATSLATTATLVLPGNMGGAATTSNPSGAAASVIYVTFAGTLTSNTTILCDILGYVF